MKKVICGWERLKAYSAIINRQSKLKIIQVPTPSCQKEMFMRLVSTLPEKDGLQPKPECAFTILHLKVSVPMSSRKGLCIVIR